MPIRQTREDLGASGVNSLIQVKEHDGRGCFSLKFVRYKTTQGQATALFVGFATIADLLVLRAIVAFAAENGAVAVLEPVGTEIAPPHLNQRNGCVLVA